MLFQSYVYGKSRILVDKTGENSYYLYDVVISIMRFLMSSI